MNPERVVMNETLAWAIVDFSAVEMIKLEDVGGEFEGGKLEMEVNGLGLSIFIGGKGTEGNA